MNKVIQDCIEQSTTDNVEQYYFDKQKFAELIVAECIGVAVDNGCGDFVDIEHLLLKHFGVE